MNYVSQKIIGTRIYALYRDTSDMRGGNTPDEYVVQFNLNEIPPTTYDPQHPGKHKGTNKNIKHTKLKDKGKKAKEIWKNNSQLTVSCPPES